MVHESVFKETGGSRHVLRDRGGARYVLGDGGAPCMFRETGVLRVCIGRQGCSVYA